MALSVMIVDDSMIMAQKLKVMLSELGHQVVRISKDGEEAIRDYALVKPDLVTMDITMPGMDGIDTVRAILASFPDARFIMVTSHGQEAMVVRAIDAGALGYVLKPVAKDRLSAMVTRALQHSAQPASHGPRTADVSARSSESESASPGPDVIDS
ncbi:MAG: CheY-like receiver [Alphaproteobacteria bacterium]|nr:MAG: CheY-like receiver [Caulobacteraceae bacterium]TPW04335.1 MAG: CheY-like receiver [Alphaproteobacteria bacterium]